MMLYGVDVSHHQGAVDWAAVKADGITFAICKASEGTSFKDGQFVANIRALKAQGMVPGAYHYLQPGNGASQADAFLAQVNAAGGPKGLLLVVDVEVASGGNPSASDAAAFLTRLRATVGDRPVGLYSGRWYWNGYLGDPAIPGAAWTWESRYVTGTMPWRSIAPRVPDSWWTDRRMGGTAATMLQTSSTAQVAGIGGVVDFDEYPGTAAALLALAGVGTPTPVEVDMPLTPADVDAVWNEPIYNDLPDGTGNTMSARRRLLNAEAKATTSALQAQNAVNASTASAKSSAASATDARAARVAAEETRDLAKEILARLTTEGTTP